MTELTLLFHFLIMCHENQHEFAFLPEKKIRLQKRPCGHLPSLWHKRSARRNINRKTCEPSRWNTQAGRASGTKEEIRTLNAYLDSLQTQAQELFRNMQIREEVLTAENVKNRFIGKEEKARTLVAVFEDHNEKMESLVGQEFEKSTLQRYKTCLMHVQDFLKLQLYRQVFISYAKEDIAYAEELYDFLEASGFDPWLDKKKLKVGANWDFFIQKSLRESTWIILLLSSVSVKKRGYVQREYRAAVRYAESKLEEDIYIIPIMIDACEVPHGIDKFQWKMYDEEDTFTQILHSLKEQRAVYLDQLDAGELALGELKEVSLSMKLPFKNTVHEDIKIPQFLNSTVLDNSFINTLLMAKGLEIINGLRNLYLDDNYFLDMNEVSKEHLYTEVNYYINYLSDQALSLTLMDDTYQGGPYSNSYVHNFNFSFNPARRIDLRNFIEINDYHQFVNDAVDRYLNVDEEDDPETITQMVKDNLNGSWDVDFSFTDTTLTLDFGNFLPRVMQYYGRIDIPLKDLKIKVLL